MSNRTLRPAIEDYFDPARCDEKPLFRQRMYVYQPIATPASSLTENDVETGYVPSALPQRMESEVLRAATHAVAGIAVIDELPPDADVEALVG